VGWWRQVERLSQDLVASSHDIEGTGTRLTRNDTADRRAVRFMKGIVTALLLAFVAVTPAMAQVPERARANIDRIIGAKGTYAADEKVYKVVIPREEATLVLDSQTLSPNAPSILNRSTQFSP
jgi:hypothetical protein